MVIILTLFILMYYIQGAAMQPTKTYPPISAMRRSTLDRLEDAVLTLFSTNDMHEISMAQIAKAANVSLQTLYKYFENKQVLVYTVIDRVLARLTDRMVDHLQGIDSVKERLRKTLWVCFDFFDHHPKALMVMSTAIPLSRHRNVAIYEDKALLTAFLTLLSDGQKKGVLNNDVSLKILFDVFMGFILRIGLMHIIRQEKEPLTKNFAQLFNLLWQAIAVKSQ